MGTNNGERLCIFITYIQIKNEDLYLIVILLKKNILIAKLKTIKYFILFFIVILTRLELTVDM